jgi:hypothetical protein
MILDHEDQRRDLLTALEGLGVRGTASARRLVALVDAVAAASVASPPPPPDAPASP